MQSASHLPSGEDRTMKNAMEWIQTRPEQNEKNTKIFNEHKKKIEALREKTQQMVMEALP